MVVGDLLKCSEAAAPEEAQPPEPPHHSSVSLLEAPILLLLQFHKAVRDELAELRRIVAEASASGNTNYNEDFVLDLRRRFEFLKLFHRKATTKMMCMKCMIIQPIGPKCLTTSCHDFSMAKYYCRICKIFDDEREIYHCPFCNLCRVRKGLEFEYFHCMKCNGCTSRLVHICREKSYEDLCPICREFMFSSTSPVKVLQCGHLMHSSCFQEYTYIHYTCPVCSKSLGDMMVYFGMIDALLAEQKMPDEYAGQTQEILCRDCEKRGATAFHRLYHKCPFCGSYNTRPL